MNRRIFLKLLGLSPIVPSVLMAKEKVTIGVDIGVNEGCMVAVSSGETWNFYCYTDEAWYKDGKYVGKELPFTYF